MLSLFHPKTGALRVRGVQQSTNVILHPWFKEQITQILAALPPVPEPALPAAVNLAQWQDWQEGLTVTFSLLSCALPPLRMLLIWDNLVGHWNADLLVWLMRQGRDDAVHAHCGELAHPVRVRAAHRGPPCFAGGKARRVLRLSWLL
jgi:hypothetical protein